MTHPPHPAPKKPYPRWLIALLTALVIAAAALGGLMALLDLPFEFSWLIAVPTGVIAGLLAGRFYGAAGVVGMAFEAVISIFAAIISVLGALFAALSP